MSDDLPTTEADEPMTGDTASEEPDELTGDTASEEPVAAGASETAGEGESDTGNPIVVFFEIPSISRLLVGLGGAVMAISTLFSWLEVGQDSFPNFAGVGTSTLGVGLMVFLVGLVLLLKPQPVGTTLGLALGSLAITLIFIVLIGPGDSSFGFGAWIGLAGTALAVLGALYQAFESRDHPTVLDFQPGSAALGAALAVVASFWLDWVGPAFPFEGFWENASGVNRDVLFGLPVLILAGVALVFTVELIFQQQGMGGRRVLLMLSQVAGTAITVIAGANVLGLAMGWFLPGPLFGSGPLVALVGGVMLTRSIRVEA
ncbi:hypothetical protein [Candidatus Poriferisocius sp.]|uniref:hypothetical protein n=1 Tax=Candidatus Poriferisocius sp. TaxID=3101276 RepID=UPI003B0212FA